jgi:Xaa-Pro aminopeptidase
MRIESLRKTFSSDIDHFIVTNPKNLFYLTGFQGSGVLVITPNDAAKLYVYRIEFEHAKSKAEGCEIELLENRTKIEEKVMNDLKVRGAKRVGIDDLPVSQYLSFKKRSRGMEILLKVDLIWKLRKRKDSAEIGKMKIAAEIATHGFEAALEAIRPEATEKEVAAEIEYRMRIHGSEGLAFDSIVASGFNSILPHVGPTEKKIKDDDFVIVDIGSIHEGYCTDITRTYVAGKPSARQRRMYDAVLRAHDSALECIQEGAMTNEVDHRARQILSKRGYGEFFVHSLGHGVGLEVHEPPRLSPYSSEKLRIGYVVTVEPGVYVPGYGGVRIEDTVAVVRGGSEKLSEVPYGLT